MIPKIVHTKKTRDVNRMESAILKIVPIVARTMLNFVEEQAWEEWGIPEQTTVETLETRLLRLRTSLGKTARAAVYDKKKDHEIRIIAEAALILMCIDDIKTRLWMDEQELTD